VEKHAEHKYKIGDEVRAIEGPHRDRVGKISFVSPGGTFYTVDFEGGHDILVEGDLRPKPTISMDTKKTAQSKLKVHLTLKRLPETDEWKVCYMINDRCNEEASYYTDDKKDAEDTMAIMQKYLSSVDPSKHSREATSYDPAKHGPLPEKWEVTNLNRSRGGKGFSAGNVNADTNEGAKTFPTRAEAQAYCDEKNSKRSAQGQQLSPSQSEFLANEVARAKDEDVTSGYQMYDDHYWDTAIQAVRSATTEDEVRAALLRPDFWNPEAVAGILSKMYNQLGSKHSAQTILKNPADTTTVQAGPELEQLRTQFEEMQAKVAEVTAQGQVYMDALAQKAAAAKGMNPEQAAAGLAALQAEAIRLQNDLDEKLKAIPQNFIQFTNGLTVAKVQYVKLSDAAWTKIFDAIRERGQGIMVRMVAVLDRIKLLYQKMTHDVKLQEFAPGELDPKTKQKLVDKNADNIKRIDQYQQSQKDLATQPKLQKYLLQSGTGRLQQPWAK